MKTIKKGNNIRRERDKYADQLVDKHGWNFCPKSEWRNKVRDRKTS